MYEIKSDVGAAAVLSSYEPRRPHFAAVRVTGSSQRVVAHVTEEQLRLTNLLSSKFFFFSDANSSAEWKSIKRSSRCFQFRVSGPARHQGAGYMQTDA